MLNRATGLLLRTLMCATVILHVGFAFADDDDAAVIAEALPAVEDRMNDVFPALQERPWVRVFKVDTPDETSSLGWLMPSSDDEFQVLQLDLELLRGRSGESLDSDVTGGLAYTRADPSTLVDHCKHAVEFNAIYWVSEALVMAWLMDQRGERELSVRLLSQARRIKGRGIKKDVREALDQFDQELGRHLRDRGWRQFISGDPFADCVASYRHAQQYLGDVERREIQELSEAMAALHQRVVAHDARERKPWDQLSVDERVHESIHYLYRVREEQGDDHRMPVVVLDPDREPLDDQEIGDPESPDHQPAWELLRTGKPAVPALIEALTDRTVTRSVAYPGLGVHVLRTGDVAQQVLTCITGRPFYDASGYQYYVCLKGEEAKLQRRYREWWVTAQHQTRRQWFEADLLAPEDFMRKAAVVTLVSEEEWTDPKPLVQSLRGLENPRGLERVLDALASAPPAVGNPVLMDVLEWAPCWERVEAANHLLTRGRRDSLGGFFRELTTALEAAESLDSFHGHWPTLYTLFRFLVRYDAVAGARAIDHILERGGADLAAVRGLRGLDYPGLEAHLVKLLAVREVRESNAQSLRVCDLAAMQLAERLGVAEHHDWAYPDEKRDVHNSAIEKQIRELFDLPAREGSSDPRDGD